MKVALVASFALAAVVVAQEPFTINTPVTENDRVLFDFGEQTGNSVTWTPDIAAVQAGFQITDRDGVQAKSAQVIINSASLECTGKQNNIAGPGAAVTTTSSSTATPGEVPTAGAPASPVPAGPTSQAPAANSTPTTPAVSRATTATSASAAATSSSSTASNGAMPTQLANMGVAGALGVALAVMLA
ncbi:hypothetical protein HGRIS_004011 [Hohenbuehelia grisea]|uniref:Uncharacterized protein n=1 Tax=Hohenbuehelia grisea TaxID=104357 RepID=A0ABR3JH68_9AGAR